MSETSSKHRSTLSVDASHPTENLGNPNPKPFEELYEIDKKIGNGSFGTVHVARDRERGDEYAVKVIDRSKLKGKDYEVFGEAQALRELSSHPHIVSLVDFFVTARFFNIVLELAQDGDLFDSIAKRKRYTENDGRTVAKEILTAVSYIHSKGFVHRDLKPENLLMANKMEGVQVADFGFAKNMLAAPTSAGLVTCCGTQSYVAPEILQGTPYGKPVDMWSCGVILYMLLGGYQPFQGGRQLVFRQIIAADYEYHDMYWGPISIEAKQLITRMLAIDPKVRITAEEALNSSWMAISDSDESISSRHLEATIDGIEEFNAHRHLKGVIHLANLVKKLPHWHASKLTFMPKDTFAGTNSDSNRLTKGKIGQKFDDIYSLESQEYQKGSTAVWKGKQKEGQKIFAVKDFKRGDPQSTDTEVLNEVAILRSLQHKYVVKLHDYFEESSRFLLVMEFMRGGCVFDRIRENEKYTECNARDLSKALLTGCMYMHSCGVAHRDLKPQNLLLETRSSDCSLKIADFGFARRVHTPLSLLSGCGTPTYVAPEILKFHPHDQSVDMWSIGVILFILLVGYPPFMEERQRDLFCKIRLGEFEFKSKGWEGISQQAKDLISSLLVVDPGSRLSAKKALEHDWFCNMDERTLLKTNLSDSQRQLKISMEKTSAPDQLEDAPWVTSVTPVV